jgi:DNA recombination protein RmuC
MDNSVILVIALFLTFVVGLVLGGVIVYLYAKAQASRLEAEHTADLEKLDWVRDSQRALEDTFEALASRSLRVNAKEFSGRVQEQLASHAGHIGVLKSSLEENIVKIDKNIRALESKREAAYSGLTEKVTNLQSAYLELRDTTAQLLNALKSGPVRGRWGELQLRRIVELAGMNEHVSFLEQVVGAEGRPDMLVHLPNQGRISVDSKCPIQEFIDAMASLDNNGRNAKLAEHAKVMRMRVKELASKAYWEEFPPSPELVIMFIPIESSLMAACECDPEIIEFALTKKVILASPITLLGFLKSIAYGWQQFTISKNAKLILEQGMELHRRTAKWLDHFRKTGVRLGSVIDAYNASVSSLQTRFFPAARKFKDLAAIADELTEVEPVSVGLNLAPKSTDVLADGPISDNPVSGEDPQPTPDRWFLTRDGKSKEGPLTLCELRELIDAGTLEPTAMARADGESKWLSVHLVPRLGHLDGPATAVERAG